MICKVCHEEITDKAKKCIKCGSYQDWRSFVNFSNISLSLLIALLSVLSLFIKTVDEYWVKSENVSVTVIDQNFNSLKIAISNSGEKEALVAPKILFLSPDRKNLFSGEIINENIQPTSDLVISPNNIKIFTAKISSPDLLHFEDYNKFESCFISTELINLKGEHTWKEAIFPCGFTKK